MGAAEAGDGGREDKVSAVLAAYHDAGDQGPGAWVHAEFEEIDNDLFKKTPRLINE